MILEGSRRAAARVNQPAAEARGPLPPLYSAATLARRRPGPLGHVRGGRGPWTHHWRIMGEFMCVNADARVLLGPHILTAGAPARRRTACKPNHFPIIIRGDAARSASNACRARSRTRPHGQLAAGASAPTPMYYRPSCLADLVTKFSTRTILAYILRIILSSIQFTHCTITRTRRTQPRRCRCCWTKGRGARGALRSSRMQGEGRTHRCASVPPSCQSNTWRTHKGYWRSRGPRSRTWPAVWADFRPQSPCHGQQAALFLERAWPRR